LEAHALVAAQRWAQNKESGGYDGVVLLIGDKIISKCRGGFESKSDLSSRTTFDQNPAFDNYEFGNT
jgi:hypothetical protein